MTANEMWAAYSKGIGASALDEGYDAWAFCGGGEAGDRLANLVLDGVKAATASAYRLYGMEGEPLPKVGEHSVVLFDDGSAACIIRTTKVSVAAFRNVDARHAWLEGEGDRSLPYWRRVHWEFFRDEFDANGLRFCEDEPIVLEEFEVVYR